MPDPINIKDDIESVERTIKGVEGYLLDNEGRFLYYAAKDCPSGSVIVEIGSWKGKSTVWIAKGIKAGGSKTKVYAIDSHTGSSEHKEKYGEVWTFDKFIKNIKKADVEDVCVPIVKTSEEAAKGWNKPIGFLFIDGAHEYESVKLDFDLWYPHVVVGGQIALHDTIKFEGPRRIVEERILASRWFKNVKTVGSIICAEKVGKNTLLEYSKNRLLLLRKKIKRARKKFKHRVEDRLAQFQIRRNDSVK